MNTALQIPGDRRLLTRLLRRQLRLLLLGLLPLILRVKQFLLQCTGFVALLFTNRVERLLKPRRTVRLSPSVSFDPSL